MDLSGQKRHAARTVRALRKYYPGAECALHHANPFQLLVATVLSAQCTDKRVNEVTPALFARFPTPAALAAGDRDEVERLIQSTGFFRSKAQSLQGLSHVIADEFGGQVPAAMEDLVRLPGVGRKTANVVLGTAFGLPAGVVVDTHVQRVSRRLGLTQQTAPVKIEADLMKLLPRKEWIDYSHRVILHGRQVCKARRPLCESCPLAKLCPRIGVSSSLAG